MLTKKDFKVEIINPEEVKNIFKSWGTSACICYDTPDKFAERVGKSCLQTGHYSGSRGDYIKFKITGVPRACYDEHTEILTKDGWKLFKDIKEDEIVATRNMQTNQVEFHKINEKICYEYSGDMHYIDQQAVNLAITSNHNVLYKKHDVRVNKDKFYLEPISNVKVNSIKMNKEFNYINNCIDKYFYIDGYTYNKKTNNGKTCEMKTKDLKLDRAVWYQFLAWYLSDGSTYYDKKENKYVISICQTQCKENIENDTINRIMNIVKDLGFNPRYDGHNIKFNSLTLGRYLKNIGTSSVKNIPFNLYDNFNNNYATIFLNEYFKGDGHIDKNGCGKFYTCSKDLADQLQQLCFIAGWSAMIYTRNKDLVGKNINICNKKVMCNFVGYVVNVSFNKRNKEPLIRLSTHQTVKNEIKNVYCVNVKNNVIFVRRQGKAVWCGNCADQLLRHEVGVYKNVRSQRYTDSSNLEVYYSNDVYENEELCKLWDDLIVNIKDVYNQTVDILLKKGYTNEQAREVARGIIPMNVETGLVIGFTVEALINMMEKRLCKCSQEHIRHLAGLMRKEVVKIIPELAPKLVPACVSKLYCPESEKRSCDIRPQKDVVERLVLEYMKNNKK